jgi:hypothetical protein
MPGSYKIIRRSDTKPTDINAYDFAARLYKYPLVGCSNYTNKIQVGDIIGLKLVSCVKNSEKFECNVIPYLEDIEIKNDPELKYLESWGSYRRVEEHLFRVTRVKNETFIVEPIFIDHDKIIVKEIKEEFDKKVYINTNKITKKNLIFACSDKVIDKYNAFDSVFSKYYAQKFMDMITDKNYVKIGDKLPYKDYRETIFDLTDSNIVDQLISFLNFVKVNDVCLKEHLGDSALNNIGTYEQIVHHMSNLYEKIKKVVGEVMTVDATYSFAKSSYLDIQKIKHKITKVKYIDIFRVYKTDPYYTTNKVERVVNWHGMILDENIRNHIKVGNIVRVFVKSDIFKDQCVIYFTLLHKISSTRYLACIENKYLSEYEDIVMTIDTRAISEIPIDWPQNEFLSEFNITEGLGYHITGLCAVKENYENYDIGYDGLFC